MKVQIQETVLAKSDLTTPFWKRRENPVTVHNDPFHFQSFSKVSLENQNL